MNNELINAVKMVAAEKNISEDVIIDTLKTSLVAACRKNFGLAQNIDVNIDENTGAMQVVAHKKIVENVEDIEDERLEISLEEARDIDVNYCVGDIAEVVITPRDFGRIAAQTAKQVVSQKFLELERDSLYNRFIEKKGKIIIGVVRSCDNHNFLISIGDVETVLSEKEQVQGETFDINDRIKLYVVDVRRYSKGVSILVSRSNPNFIKGLFEREIPEVASGIVEVVNVSREPGKRSKVAIRSTNPDVEAIGSCIGENGMRINTILSELNGEKIDLVKWYDDMEDYIRSALSPAKIEEIRFNSARTEALIIVDKGQVSLAIGKGGQNVRLAAKLVGIRLDVKTREQLGDIENFGPEFLPSNEEKIGTVEDISSRQTDEEVNDFENDSDDEFEDQD